jgi:hypothetical protein
MEARVQLGPQMIRCDVPKPEASNLGKGAESQRSKECKVCYQLHAAMISPRQRSAQDSFSVKAKPLRTPLIP